MHSGAILSHPTHFSFVTNAVDKMHLKEKTNDLRKKSKHLQNSILCKSCLYVSSSQLSTESDMRTLIHLLFEVHCIHAWLVEPQSPSCGITAKISDRLKSNKEVLILESSTFVD